MLTLAILRIKKNDDRRNKANCLVHLLIILYRLTKTISEDSRWAILKKGQNNKVRLTLMTIMFLGLIL